MNQVPRFRRTSSPHAAIHIPRSFGFCQILLSTTRTGAANLVIDDPDRALIAMNRRRFLALTAASGLVLTARAFAEEKRWRVAVIGHTGRGDYGHGLDTMWLKLAETQIVAVADADAKGLAAAQKRLGGVQGFADYRAMLAEMKPEIVAVCPRHMQQHRDMAIAAAESGARGIYIEKPFCRTLAEADEIIAACDRHGAKLAIAHRNRYHPALGGVARLLKEETIGRLLEVRGRGKEDQRGGCVDLWVLGSHVLNLAVHFAGQPLACSATLLQDGRPAVPADLREGNEDVGPIAGNAVHARFETKSGIPVFFDSMQNAGDKEAGFGLQLLGTRGLIDLRIDTAPLAHLVPGNPFQPTTTTRPWIPISSAGAGVPEPIAEVRADVMNHVTAARDLLAAIRENRAPLCSGADGRVTVEMIMAVLASHVQNGARVPLPLQTRENPLSVWR